jgi:hypothetical protein
MKLLGQQRDFLSQCKEAIRPLELLSKLMDRRALLFGLRNVSDQSHRAEKSAKDVIEPSGVYFCRESE